MSAAAIASAAATVVPAFTTTGIWLINKEMDSDIFLAKGSDQTGHQLREARRQISLDVDGSGLTRNLCGQQFGSR